MNEQVLEKGEQIADNLIAQSLFSNQNLPKEVINNSLCLFLIQQIYRVRYLCLIFKVPKAQIQKQIVLLTPLEWRERKIGTNTMSTKLGISAKWTATNSLQFTATQTSESPS